MIKFFILVLVLKNFGANGDENNHFQYEKSQEKEEVIDLNTFKDTILYGCHFVKFFTPLCGFCKQLAPAWLELKEYYQDHNSLITQVNCISNGDICTEYNIRGYPTLLFFINGKLFEDYSGERDFQSLRQYVDDRLEEHKKMVEVPELSMANFEANIDLSFILFYLPTCPHCQEVFPLWRLFHKLVISAGNATQIAMINCMENRQLCVNEKVLSYPAFIFFKNKRRIDIYRGPTDLQAFINFAADMSSYSVESKEELEVPSYVRQLETDDFTKYKNFLFVKFFVPWCQFCKNLAPLWEDAAIRMVTNAMISFADVDCSVHDFICKKYQILGYPSLLLFLDGKFLDMYTGSHDAPSIIDYATIVMNRHTEL